MSSDAILFFQQVPSMIWSLFTSFDIPGLGFTPGAFMFGILSVALSLYVMTNVISFGSNVLDSIERHKPQYTTRQTIGPDGRERITHTKTTRW